MDNDNSSNLLNNEAAVSFIVAATRYCALLETDSTPLWTLDTMKDCRSVLANLYASALSLPPLHASVNYAEDGDYERIVTEESYTKIRRRLERFFGMEDRFLDAQQEGQKYMDRPVSVSVSELMTDLYQSLADPLWNIRQNGTDAVAGTLADMQYAFEYEWGKSLLMVLKQLHDLVVNPNFEPLSSTYGEDEDLGEPFSEEYGDEL